MPAQFSAVPGIFDPSERQLRVGGDPIVYKHHTCLQAIDTALIFALVPGPDACPESIRGTVSDFNRMVKVARTKQQRDYVMLSKQDLAQLHVSADAADRALRGLEANKVIAIERRGRGRKPHIKPA